MLERKGCVRDQCRIDLYYKNRNAMSLLVGKASSPKTTNLFLIYAFVCVSAGRSWKTGVYVGMSLCVWVRVEWISSFKKSKIRRCVFLLRSGTTHFFVNIWILSRDPVPLNEKYYKYLFFRPLRYSLLWILLLIHISEVKMCVGCDPVPGYVWSPAGQSATSCILLWQGTVRHSKVFIFVNLFR